MVESEPALLPSIGTVLSQLVVMVTLVVAWHLTTSGVFMGRSTGANDDDLHCHHPLDALGMILKEIILVLCQTLTQEEWDTPVPASPLPQASRCRVHVSTPAGL